MVSVFAVSGFKHIQGDGILRTLKIRVIISFEGKVRMSVLCHKILRMLKIPTEYEIYISLAELTDISPCFSTRCLLVFARELLWIN
jgi:hypothetical protein